MKHPLLSPALHRIGLCLLLSVMPLLLAAQKKLSGSVVDAVTGERLSFVMFYLASGRGTLSNFDGDFMLEIMPEDSVTIAALLHDVCKANIYKTVQKWRKDENNRWESYDAYDTDYSRFPVGHGEKSVIMLLRLGLQLTNDEIIAIRWHMGAWNLPMQSYEDKQNISVAYDGCPLAAIIQAADALATHILETKKEES